MVQIVSGDSQQTVHKLQMQYEAENNSGITVSCGI
jgi:hypothetical protein